MGRWDGGWAPYVSVEKRRQQAEREIKKLLKKGIPIEPVIIEGKALATTFWGKAWCENMKHYQDYASRLPRGRSYVRNGAVVDLQITAGTVKARVWGSQMYTVTVNITKLPQAHWKTLCADCTGSVASLVELLKGKFSQGMMERFCRQDGGLFPKRKDIQFACTCPDGAVMCKHVAAVLFGIGARFDHKPELLFRLRAVDENDLISTIDKTALPLATTKVTYEKRLESDDLSALFGLDIAAESTMAPLPKKPRAVNQKKQTASSGATNKAKAVTPKQRVKTSMPKGKTAQNPPKAVMTSSKKELVQKPRTRSKSLIQKAAASGKTSSKTKAPTAAKKANTKRLR